MRTISIDEAAESLGVSSDTIRAWVQRGELLAVNVSLDRASRKPRLRVRESDLETFLASRQTVDRSRRPTRRNHSRQPIKQYV